jgi:uncharacterized paraquat-inducible protein A
VAKTKQKRPWLAAALAFLYPGLGHIYLREWLRAILWFGLVVSTSTLLVGEAAIPDALSVDAFVTASQAMSAEATIALLAITVLSMADAYWMASRANESAEAETDTVAEGESCPHCGKELDEDISFCHWCTTEIERPESDT